MGNPIECWVIRVVWNNGELSKYASVTPLPKWRTGSGALIGEHITISHPITGAETHLDLKMAREVSILKGTVQLRPKTNPLNDLDHYDNPEN